MTDVTAFGGTTKEYHVDIDPGRLISYGVNLSQVMSALTNSNANVGGSYLTIGPQSYNIRGLGLINGIADIENVMVAEKNGTPIFIRNLGNVAVGSRVRLGKVGIDDRDDVVEGVMLLQRGYKALNVLEKVRGKVEDLNAWKLPTGVKIKTFLRPHGLDSYDGGDCHGHSDQRRGPGLYHLVHILRAFSRSPDCGPDHPAFVALYLFDDGPHWGVGESDFARIHRFRHYRRCHADHGGKYFLPSGARNDAWTDGQSADRAGR